jgi:hypothetical protein
MLFLYIQTGCCVSLPTSFFASFKPFGITHHTMTDHDSLVADEIFAIHQSGEMPEVALHTALYDLREDPAGPRLHLTAEDIELLKDAVEQRYQRILLRDLNPRLRDRSIYRGLDRAIANWQRLTRFCQWEGRDIASHRQAAAEALRTFMAVETDDVAHGRQPGAVNCTAAQLKAFAETLGMAEARLPENWETICR